MKRVRGLRRRLTLSGLREGSHMAKRYFCSKGIYFWRIVPGFSNSHCFNFSKLAWNAELKEAYVADFRLFNKLQIWLSRRCFNWGLSISVPLPHFFLLSSFLLPSSILPSSSSLHIRVWISSRKTIVWGDLLPFLLSLFRYFPFLRFVPSTCHWTRDLDSWLTISI